MSTRGRPTGADGRDSPPGVPRAEPPPAPVEPNYEIPPDPESQLVEYLLEKLAALE